MMPGPKVTVTVITYNHASFIGPCLESALAQSCEVPFEVVVGDDASTDGTQEVVREIAARDSRVLPLLHSRHVGVRNNWQAVLDASRGEFIAHLDGDDLMRPGKLQRQVEYLDRHVDCAMCFHNMRVFRSEDGRDLGVFTVHGAPTVRTLDDLVRYGTVYCHSSKMYRRSAIPEAGLDTTTQIVMDWLTHLEHARAGGIGYLDEVLGDYRRHGQGSSQVRDAVRIGRAIADQVYTLVRAAAFGASDEAIRAGSGRIRFLGALQYLDAGHDSEFRQAIEAFRQEVQAAAGVREVLFRLRRHPGACRLLVTAYRALHVTPGHRHVSPRR